VIVLELAREYDEMRLLDVGIELIATW